MSGSKKKSLLWQSFRCVCPKCGQSSLFKDGLFSLVLKESCPCCGLDLSKSDSADGPAVFLIFVLGFLLVPLALIFDAVVQPPLWIHAVLWSIVAVGLTVGTLKPIKSLVISLQYRHRASDWDKG